MKYEKGCLYMSSPNTLLWVQVIPETAEEKQIFGDAALRVWQREVGPDSRKLPQETNDWQKLREYLGRDPLDWAREQFHNM